MRVFIHLMLRHPTAHLATSASVGSYGSMAKQTLGEMATSELQPGDKALGVAGSRWSLVAGPRRVLGTPGGRRVAGWWCPAARMAPVVWEGQRCVPAAACLIRLATA